MRYRVIIIAVHTISPGKKGSAAMKPSTVVETDVVVDTYAQALQVLNDESDSGASGGVRDYVVHAQIVLHPPK